MEPFATLIVSALALGAAAGAQSTIEQVIKDAYAGLRQVIVDRYSRHARLVDAMDSLAEEPQDASRRETLGDELESAEVTNDEAVIEKAQAVHAAMNDSAPTLAKAIGMDIGELEAAVLEVENVQAGKTGIGVRIGKAQIRGSASFRNIGREDSDPNT
jgi:hypothetical protein